jgi:hypothetical protein
MRLWRVGIFETPPSLEPHFFSKGLAMGLPEGYVRKGRPLNFQLDHDAVELLYEMVSSKKGHGKYISELIRRDAIRRQE